MLAVGSLTAACLDVAQCVASGTEIGPFYILALALAVADVAWDYRGAVLKLFR